jgi:2,3-diketo-5-methylthio-1-phosphopentane phosphatase
MQVFCDFDGTISTEDATDFILSRLAPAKWQEIEEEWKQGIIGSAECMQRQIALIEVDKAKLDAALDEIAIDPGFTSFINFCHMQGLPVIIISDGVDYFIQRILARYHLQHLPVIANRLSILDTNGKTQYRLSSPYSHASCASVAGVCKCRAINVTSKKCVYIGDGRSDFCVSSKPDLVFAKDKLAEYCVQQKIAFIPYQQFTDVTKALQHTLSAANENETKTAAYAFA